MKKLWLLLVIPALLMLWWAAERKDAVPSIHFVPATQNTIISTISTNGKVEAAEYAAARAEISGVVMSVRISRGDNVQAGQVLITLDNQTEQSALTSATAAVQEARAASATLQQGGRASQLSEIENGLKTAQLSLDQAQRVLASTQRLYDKQAATHQEVLNAQDAVDQARVQVTKLQEQRSTLVTASDKTVGQAKLEDATGALALARHRLSLTTITAPINGTAYQFDIRRGDFLNPGDLVAMVGKLDQVRVKVYVDEPELGRVAKGMDVDITWEARGGQHWKGHVDQIPTEIVPFGARNVGIVSCLIDNPNHDLLPGTNIDAKVISAVVKDAVSIPKQALQSQGTQNGVYKLSDDTVVWTPVVSGVSNVTNVEIKSGLQAGDRVALPSDAALKNGMTVKPLFN